MSEISLFTETVLSDRELWPHDDDDYRVWTQLRPTGRIARARAFVFGHVDAPTPTVGYEPLDEESARQWRAYRRAVAMAYRAHVNAALLRVLGQPPGRLHVAAVGALAGFVTEIESQYDIFVLIKKGETK